VIRDDLNRLVLALAPPHEARAHAPGTFPDLIRCGSLIVWDGASDCTIYGDARVNHAFRAWHDAAHIAGGFPFTLAGEIAACEFQIAQAYARFPRLPDSLAATIRREVIGQAEYFAAYGTFPANQIEFHNANGGVL
jgi:hypothetical protein